MATKERKISWIARHFIQEPTRASFARNIESFNSVPETYKDFFIPILKNGQDFPYTIITPPHIGYMHRAPEKLICSIKSNIHVLEKTGDTFKDTCYPVAGISYVEVRAVLLDSSIKITGMTDTGKPAASIIHYNSVTDYLFTPILKKIRGFETAPDLNLLQKETGKFDQWSKSNFKFMNYARSSLLGCEQVMHSDLQPEIRTKGFKIIGISYYKTISPTHAGILTDRELIMIREEVWHNGGDRYGGIWDYIPLDKIAGLSVQEAGNELLSLSIRLPHDVQLEFLYRMSAKAELDRLLSQARELTV